MSWKKDAKLEKQKTYGLYVLKCKELRKNPLPYHEFDVIKYKEKKIEYILTGGRSK